eukprot:12898347-Prorocentrum_lima.AAC.1
MVSGHAPRRGGSATRIASIWVLEAAAGEGVHCMGSWGEGRRCPPNSEHQCWAQRDSIWGGERR